MTQRVYLTAVRFHDAPPDARDIAVERVFVNAAGVEEVWVETESDAVPEVGRAAAFSLHLGHDIGFKRITGTVEQRIDKTRGR